MLHQRVKTSDEIHVSKDEKYDAEMGESLEESTVPVSEMKLNQNYLNNGFKIFITTIFFILIMGTYIEVTDKRRMNDKNLNYQIRRKLNEPNNITNIKNECDRNNFLNVFDYIHCFTKKSYILIISDSSNDIEILESEKYKPFPIEFKHIDHMMHLQEDKDIFFDKYEEKSPWVFLDGYFIGNFTDLDDYYEHNILQVGMEDAPIPPALNREELNLLKSSDMPENLTDELRIRKNLRKFIPKEVDELTFLRTQYNIILEQKKLLEEIKALEEKNQKNEENV